MNVSLPELEKLGGYCAKCRKMESFRTKKQVCQRRICKCPPAPSQTPKEKKNCADGKPRHSAAFRIGAERVIKGNSYYYINGKKSN